MRANLTTIVEQLPDVVTVPEIVRRVNRANGIGPLQWPRPSNTHSWSEIHDAIRAFGYRPTFAAGFGHDASGLRIPVLLHVFSRLPTLEGTNP